MGRVLVLTGARGLAWPVFLKELEYSRPMCHIWGVSPENPETQWDLVLIMNCYPNRAEPWP